MVRPASLAHHLAAEEADEAVTVEEQPDMGFDGVVVRIAEGVQVPGLLGLPDELFKLPTPLVVASQAPSLAPDRGSQGV